MHMEEGNLPQLPSAQQLHAECAVVVARVHGDRGADLEVAGEVRGRVERAELHIYACIRVIS